MDYHQRADSWVNSILDNENQQEVFDPTFYAKQSRKHLLYLTFYTTELVNVARGIRWRLTVIAAILVLCVLGIFSLGRF
jgi:hypothetical protein